MLGVYKTQSFFLIFATVLATPLEAFTSPKSSLKNRIATGSFSTPLTSTIRCASFNSGDGSNNRNRDYDDEEISLPRKIFLAWNNKIGREDKHILESNTFIATPAAAAVASYYLYPFTSILFHNIVDALSSNKFEPVDGGQLQWSILLPALNGVVMTVVSLLYANLIATTGTQLRNRQMIVHSSLSQETQGVRDLIQLVPFYPGMCRAAFSRRIRSYLYVLVEETDPDNQQVEELRGDSLPLAEYRNGLHSLSAVGSTDLGGGVVEVNSNILERSYETLQKIYDARNARITALQTKFPQLHYVTITALTTGILLIFLLETDRKVILFLDKFQIRLVWSILVGTVTAIYCIGIDLSNPFIGTYTVPADQLLEDSGELLELIEVGATVKKEVEKTPPPSDESQPLSSQLSEQVNGEASTPVNGSTDDGGTVSLYEQYMNGRNQ